jgi:hypothetical protein
MIYLRSVCRLMEVSGGKVPVLRNSEKGVNMPDSDVM